MGRSSFNPVGKSRHGVQAHHGAARRLAARIETSVAAEMGKYRQVADGQSRTADADSPG